MGATLRNPAVACIRGFPRMRSDHARVTTPGIMKVSRDACPREAVRHGAVPAVSEYLLHRVSRGEEGAVRECIERYAGLVWSLAQRVGLPRAECEDAVHEVFTELWRTSGKYDPSIASETAFVATIARRRLIDRRRRVTRRPQPQQILDDAVRAPTGDPPAMISDEAKRARAALSELSPEQQKVIRLSVYEGLSHDLIARSTGMPLGTVKTHARRGLIRLREILGVPKQPWETGPGSSPQGGAV